MIRCTALVIAGFACGTALAQVNSGIGSPATAIGALERVVTGVPFSAESVTEFIQTASDGSHIKQATTAVVARDSNGRTRYGQTTLPLLLGEPRVFTIIRDPVAGVRYWIDSHERVARREPIRAPGFENRTKALEERGRASEPGVSIGDKPIGNPQEEAIKVARQSVAQMLSARAGEALARTIQPEITPLGDQTIEGVTATGARVRAMIPAGQIGNENSLVFRSEAWYSHELGIVVRSRVMDPILGDTTFQMTQLRRGEPSSSLFEVPAGYRVTGAGISSEPGAKRKD